MTDVVKCPICNGAPRYQRGLPCELCYSRPTGAEKERNGD
jgi:hypothetical protein